MDAKTEIINYVTEIVDIQTLTPNPKNPRQIKGNDFERLKKQILKLKQYKPIIIDKRTGFMIGGHMRLEALKSLGQTNVLVSYIESKDDEQAFEYMLSDNDNAGYTDADMLANMIPQYPTLDWKDYAVTLEPGKIIADLLSKEITEDEAPAVDEIQTISISGEVYQLGRHRLMCGDATKIEDIEKLLDTSTPGLLLTDPPYNVGLSYNSHHDNMDPEVYLQFMKDWFNPAMMKTENQIVFTGNINTKLWLCNMDPLYMAIWDKGEGASSYSNKVSLYTSWEPIFFHGKFNNNRHTDVFNFVAGGETGIDHPCPKPVRLLAELINYYAGENGNIIDLFGGSGSTIIACEQTNRTCYMMEIDPKYCDVIRKRYSKIIGKENEWQTITPVI